MKSEFESEFYRIALSFPLRCLVGLLERDMDQESNRFKSSTYIRGEWQVIG